MGPFESDLSQELHRTHLQVLPKALLQRADPDPRGGGQLCDGQVLVCGAFDEFDGSADLARHGRPVIRLARLYGMRRHEGGSDHPRPLAAQQW